MNIHSVFMVPRFLPVIIIVMTIAGISPAFTGEEVSVGGNIVSKVLSPHTTCRFDRDGNMVDGGEIEKSCTLMEDPDPRFQYALIKDALGKLTEVVRIDTKEVTYQSVWRIPPPGVVRL